MNLTSDAENCSTLANDATDNVEDHDLDSHTDARDANLDAAQAWSDVRDNMDADDQRMPGVLQNVHNHSQQADDHNNEIAILMLMVPHEQEAYAAQKASDIADGFSETANAMGGDQDAAAELHNYAVNAWTRARADRRDANGDDVGDKEIADRISHHVEKVNEHRAKVH